MLEKIRKISIFIESNILYFIFGFGFLSLLPYVSFFKALHISKTPGIIYRGITLGLILLLTVIVLVSKRKIPSKKVIIPCSIYVITNLVSIFVSPLIKKVDVPMLQQMVGIAVIFGNIISILIAFHLFNLSEIKQKQINIITYVLIGFGIFLCLYSYIFEYKDIADTFTKEYGWNYDVTSIFAAKTTYGFCLLVISIYTIIYALINKKYWFYIFPVFFLVNSFIARTKTAILCILILLIGVFFYHLVKTWKQHKKKWIIAISIFITLAIAGLLLVTLKVGPFKTINKFISEVIIGDGVVVTKDRLQKFSKIINGVDYPLGIIFGCGERITNYIIAPAKVSGDCIYVTNYASGGIIKFVIYLVLIAYIFYKYIKNDASKSTKFIQCLILSTYLIAGLFEDDSLIGLNLSFFFISTAIYSSNSIFKILEQTNS